MPGLPVVGGGVFANRLVAAADVPALLTHPQMNPSQPLGQALLAAGDLSRQVEMLDRVEMSAGGGRAPTLAWGKSPFKTRARMPAVSSRWPGAA